MKTPPTACQRGHERTPETTYTYTLPNGKLRYFCIVCRNMRTQPKRRNTGRNEFRSDGATAFLCLSSGKQAIIEAQDLSRCLAKGRWLSGLNGYVLHSGKGGLLHRFIMDAQPHEVVDHINRNVLDCRQSNLRIVTTQQNVQNQKLHGRNSKSGHKNVHWDAHCEKWKVSIKHCGKVHYGGYFDSLADATVKASELRQRFHTHCPENSLPDNG